jgi:hypothetical protein
MNTLTSQQLAFILDIKKEEARAQMCHAWAKHKGIKNAAYWNEKNKIVDDYPKAMEIEILAEHLNLPTLQQMVNDIELNYLIRPATKKWILCDYPEKQVKSCGDAGKPLRIGIPPALKTMLHPETIDRIKSEWEKRFPKAKVNT